MEQRISFDAYFLGMLDHIASRSTCIRRKVGAIITKEDRIIATGYNGALPGVPHCTPETCIRAVQGIPSGERLDMCVASHAEANSIAQAAKFGHAVNGCTLYVTYSPCTTCTKLIIATGITRVVWRESYPDEFSQHLFKNAGYVQAGKLAEIDAYSIIKFDIHRAANSIF